MANTTLVSSTVRDVNAIPTVVDTTARSTVRSSMKQTTPFTSKRETNASGLEIYTKSYEIDGIPSNATKLISKSRRPGSFASSNRSGRSWLGGMFREKIYPLCAPLSKIVNYLSTLFDQGFQYQTVNAHRSAILVYHNFINGEPKTCALLTGTFSQRPPQPRYICIWGIDVVLTYIKNNMFVNCRLSEKKLTCKSAVLPALSSVLRASSIQHLNINFMPKTNSIYKFYFDKLHKSWRKGKTPPAVT